MATCCCHDGSVLPGSCHQVDNELLTCFFLFNCFCDFAIPIVFYSVVFSSRLCTLMLPFFSLAVLICCKWSRPREFGDANGFAENGGVGKGNQGGSDKKLVPAK